MINKKNCDKFYNVIQKKKLRNVLKKGKIPFKKIIKLINLILQQNFEMCFINFNCLD